MLALAQRFHLAKLTDPEPTGPRWLRWLARGFSLLIGGGIVFFMLAEGLYSLFGGEEASSDSANVTTAEVISLIALFIGALGLLVAVWRPQFGAIVAFIAGLVVIIAVPRSFAVALFVWLVALAHLLSLFIGRYDRPGNDEDASKPWSGWV